MTHDHDQSFTKTALAHGGITDIPDTDAPSHDHGLKIIRPENGGAAHNLWSVKTTHRYTLETPVRLSKPF